LFFGALRTPHVSAGRQCDPQGERGPNGRSPRICSSYTAVVANARSRLRSEGCKPVNRKRPAYVTCPMRHDAPSGSFIRAGAGRSALDGRPAVRLAFVAAPAIQTGLDSPGRRREVTSAARWHWRLLHFRVTPAIECEMPKLPHHKLIAFGVARDLSLAVRAAQVRDAKLRDEALRSARVLASTVPRGPGG